MKNKKLLEIISKSKNKIIRETLADEYKKMNRSQRENMSESLETFSFSLETDPNFMAKAIAAHIRMYMEDFHCKHLSDEQMKELNPIIRNAIYTFLIDYYNDNLIDISSVCRLNLPSYWEDCEYLNGK